MSTLSSVFPQQASNEQPEADISAQWSLLAVVQRQLAVLKSLATEGQAEAAALQIEVADLAARLSAVTTRVAKLESTLSNHAHLLGAIHDGLGEAIQRAARDVRPATPPPAVGSDAPTTQGNGAHQAHEPALPTRPVGSAEETTVPASWPESAVERTAAAAIPAPAPIRHAPPSQPVSTPGQPAPRIASVPASAPSQSMPVRVQSAPNVTSALTPPAPVAPSANRPALAATPSVAPSPPPQPAPAPAPLPAETTPVINDGRLRIQRGSTVEVAFEDGSTELYTIVRQEEANPVRNLLGENSPLGIALLGACIDDVRRFRVRAAGPEQTVRVRSIA